MAGGGGWGRGRLRVVVVVVAVVVAVVLEWLHDGCCFFSSRRAAGGVCWGSRIA
jgi:hypothetical protein